MQAGAVGVGRIAGVPVRLHWTWAIVVALLTWSLAARQLPDAAPGHADAAYVAAAAGSTLVFFVSLLAHELGHAVRARHEGVRIEGITLWVFGGVARFGGTFPSAEAELRIALAGPAVTAVFSAVALAAGALVPMPALLEASVLWLGATNVLLLGFNLLPAFPLDGGRVLRALLWRRGGDFARATRQAARTGVLLGQLLVGGGLALFVLGGLGGLWLALIGWFIITAAVAESDLAELEHVLAGLRVSDAMVASPVTVAAETTLDTFMEGVFARSRHIAYPVLSDERLVGEVTFAAVAAVPSAQWPARRVRDVMLPLDEVLVVEEDAPLLASAAEVMRRPPHRALVTHDGRLAGLLSLTDVSRLIELRRLTAGASLAGSVVHHRETAGFPP